MQKDKSSIADVLPTLIITNSKWNRMKVTGIYKSLFNYLVDAMKYKFKYEKNSNYYCVASLFNISKLHIWAKRTDCKFIRDSVISNLVTTAELFLEKEVEKTEQKISLSKMGQHISHQMPSGIENVKKELTRISHAF